MNLHGIVASIVGAVNPLISASWQQSAGYTTSATGAQVPAYATPITVSVQLQPLTTSQIAHLDALGIQGTLRALYMPGAPAGAVRVAQMGGDLFTLIDAITGTPQIWLAVGVDEMWPDWSRVVVQLQNGS